MANGISTSIGFRRKKSWKSYWTTRFVSAVVENAAPTNLVLTFLSKRTIQVSDLAISNNTAESLSWVGNVCTVVMGTALVYGDAPTVNFKSIEAKSIANNVAATTELTTYITGLSTPLSLAQRRRLNQFVKRVVTGLEITNFNEFFDTFYVRINETAEVYLKNLVKDAHHSTSPSPPTFTAFEGSQGDGISQYLDWNYNPKTQGVNFTQNSATLGCYIRNDVNMASGSDLGARDGATSKRLMIYARSNNIQGAFVNTDSTVNNVTANTNSKGLCVGVRETNQIQKSYKGRRLIANNNIASSGLPNFNIYEGALNNAGTAAGFTTHQFAFSWASKLMSLEQLGVLADAMDEYLDSIEKSVVSVIDTFTSPVINEIQGYTTDGTYHYTFGNTLESPHVVRKRNDDATWTVAAENTDAFDGLDLNHIGDGCYYDGNLYAVAEKYTDVNNITGQCIILYSASDCSRVSVHDISAQGGNVAGCVVDNGIIYVVYFDDSTHIKKFDLTTFEYLGQITLASAIVGMQGITVKGNYFYITNHTTSENIYRVNKDGTFVLNILTRAAGTENEGIDYLASTLRYQIYTSGVNATVHYLQLD